MNAKRIEQGAAIAVGAAVILFTLAIQFGSQPLSDVRGSVASPEQEGRRALFLLFEELGFAPEAWRKFPGALPHGEHVVWMAGAPGAADADHGGEDDEENDARVDEDADGSSDPDALEFQSLRQYRRFVEEGGTIVLAASDEALEFLVDDMELDAFADVTIDDALPDTLRRVRTSAGTEWTAQWQGVFEEPDPLGLACELWSGRALDGGADETLALVVPSGDGRVVLLADDRFLDTQNIGKEEHAALAVALFDEVARGGRLLFDEYALGLWEASTPIELATGPRLAWATVHLTLFALLALWRLSWVSRFPRDPLPLAQVSPLSRARAQAGLFLRAGRFGALARILRDGVLRRLRAKLRVARDAPLATVGRRAGTDAAGLERWRVAFEGRLARDAAELESLGHALSAIEADVDATVGQSHGARRSRAHGTLPMTSAARGARAHP